MISDFQEKLEEPGQQVMPEEGIAPDFNRLKADFEAAITDASDVTNQMRENYETRFGIWAGQSADGKKHSREGANLQPTPWDGASDQKALIVDEIINAKAAMVCTAFQRSNMVAVPVEGTDMARAKVVSSFMKWLVSTQIPHMDREVELLAQYILEKGVALTGQFWEVCQEKSLEFIRLEEVEKQVPGITEVLADPALEDSIIGLILEQFPLASKRKAKAMIKELRETGKTSVPVLMPEYSRPVLKAFNLDEDIFIHPSATDIENAPGIYRVQYYTPAQLRGLAQAEGWNSDWVEHAIETAKGHRLTLLPETGSGNRGLLSEPDRYNNLVGVVYAYEKLADEDGVTGIYLSVFNPQLPPSDKHNGYAHFGLLGYKHGQYPFVLHRREYLSRRLHDSRGVPEVGKPYQDIIKATRDARIDASSLSVLPPMMYPQGRPPSVWGPGAKVPYRRDPKEYQFADRPTYDVTNTEVEKTALGSVREYFGIATPDADAALIGMKQQFEVNRFLKSLSFALRQVWSLYQQYGKDDVYFRVIGVGGQDMLRFEKGDPRESYDFFLSFDSIVFDREAAGEKLEAIAKVVATADRYGQVDYAEFLPLMLEAIDPAVAERIVLPKETASQKSVKEYQDLFTKAFVGIDVDISEGMPPEIGLQTLQQYVQAPEVQQRMQNKDDPLGGRLEKLAKQMQHTIAQRENAKIGRLGA
jgi:hypothetical protein